jgi:hypothetical protein
MRLLLALRFCSLAWGAADSTIYIIRHGEKKSTEGCLNGTGEARAAALPGIFSGLPSPAHATFAVPKALFANHYDNRRDCERCLETLQPISVALGLPIIFDYGYPHHLGGNKRAATAMLRANASTLLVAWEHVNIQFLVEHLGVPRPSVPHWPDDSFDTVYAVSVSHQRVVDFAVLRQNFTHAPAGAELIV